MNPESNQAATKESWARRLLVSAVAITGLFILADSFLNFIPEETAPAPISEIVVGAAVVSLAGIGNRVLKNSEL